MVTKDSLNPNLLGAAYAVRGPIVLRAQQLEEEGKKIIYCNIGNPQALKQKPLSYIRQTLSLLEYPELLLRPEAVKLFPSDIVAGVREILRQHPPGTGAYTQSPGLPFVRQAVADFIEKRDGIPATKDHVILTDGASKGVQAVLLALFRQERDGFMVPIPQYPLYSASIRLYGGRQIGYLLDEQNHWQLNESILSESIAGAARQGTHPVALVVINPGNPTGGVLSLDNIKMIIRFAKQHQLAIIADEVYQENVYQPGVKFHSFAKVLHQMNGTSTSLFSMHSVSKGFLGECGHRGGYLEIRNVPDDVMAEFVKLQSISLCANVSGQIATYLMVSPPQPGGAGYETYVRERNTILDQLKKKSEILAQGIAGIEGMELVQPQGAMYGFVRFNLPPDRQDGAESQSVADRQIREAERDTAYCLALLEEMGVCVVPGSGFGQRPGTFHFRTTFLPPTEEIEEFVAKLKVFHEKYVRELEEV